MVTVQEEYTKKSKKLLQYVESYKKKEVNPKNLKNIIVMVRYTLKYLNKSPKDFITVFRGWLELIKDLVVRCDTNIQVQCLTQISIVLMYMLRVRFRPIFLIEDLLSDWIDLLVVVPINVTAVIVERNHSRIHSIIASLKTIGHFKHQAYLVEILNRYLLSVNDGLRRRTITQLFESEGGGSSNISDKDAEEVAQLLYQFDMNDLEKSIRLFLNKFNSWCKASVSTYEVRSITVGSQIVAAPLNGNQWVDLNRGAPSLSFYGDSSSLLWNYFEIIKPSVAHISRGLNMSVSIKLNTKLLVSYCVGNSDYKRFENAKHVTISFCTPEAQEQFLSVIIPIFLPEAETPSEVAEPVDLNMTDTTLNMSMLSKGFHNGDMDARFSFAGDYDDDDDVVEREHRDALAKRKAEIENLKKEVESVGKILKRRQTIRPVKRVSFQDEEPKQPVFVPAKAAPAAAAPKRKLYSHNAFEVNVSPVNTPKSASSPGSLVIVMNEEDVPQKEISAATSINSTTQVLSKSKQSPGKSSETRVPIYRTILNDWNSDAESTSYTFVSNDPPGMTTKVAKKRTRLAAPPSRVANKTAPAKRAVAQITRRRNTIAARKGPAKKKLPLDFVRKIVKRPCKEAAQEAKRVFGLQDTPPYHGEAEKGCGLNVTEGAQIGIDNCNNESTLVEGSSVSGADDTTMKSGFGFYRERSTVAGGGEEIEDNNNDVEMGIEPPSLDNESYAVFMKFIEDYRSLSMQMGDVMQGIRKMKTKIVNSARLTEYQKAGLLVELCNFLLKR